jgi:hypothetical protein
MPPSFAAPDGFSYLLTEATGHAVELALLGYPRAGFAFLRHGVVYLVAYGIETHVSPALTKVGFE